VGFELITLVVIGTDCTGSCKSNYLTITAIMTPAQKLVPKRFRFSLDIFQCSAFQDMSLNRDTVVPLFCNKKSLVIFLLSQCKSSLTREGGLLFNYLMKCDHVFFFISSKI